jgi:hypothetical protein
MAVHAMRCNLIAIETVLGHPTDGSLRMNLKLTLVAARAVSECVELCEQIAKLPVTDLAGSRSATARSLGTHRR